MNTAVTLPLPPTANHAYKLGLHNGRPMMYASDELVTFSELAWLECRNVETPKLTPLSATVRLYLSRAELNRVDIDGMLKPVLDAVFGSRRDQWVRTLHVTKELATGEPKIEVEITWEGE